MMRRTEIKKTAVKSTVTKKAVIRKRGIWAAVCSLVFVINCSACGTEERDILLIGQQENLQTGGQDTLPAEQEETKATAAVLTAAQGEDRYAETEQEVCVYVCGAVKSPGVVYLRPGSRAADALEAAGGFAVNAAGDAVNLAARVSDGEKLYFPTQEEYQAKEEQEAAAAGGLVNINTAGTAELCTLPGIGESRAADIIAYREACGGFTVCEDIMQVSGIKESVYNKISDKITVK